MLVFFAGLATQLRARTQLGTLPHTMLEALQAAMLHAVHQEQALLQGLACSSTQGILHIRRLTLCCKCCHTRVPTALQSCWHDISQLC